MKDNENDRNSRTPTPAPEHEVSVREAAARDFAEARILVDEIYREYRESGGRTALDQLLDRQKDLPWFPQRTRDTG